MAAVAANGVRFHFITVRVRFHDGAYKASFRRKNASCTWSASAAVRRLAEKLGYPPSTDVVRLGESADGDGEVWKIQEVG